MSLFHSHLTMLEDLRKEVQQHISRAHEIKGMSTAYLDEEHPQVAQLMTENAILVDMLQLEHTIQRVTTAIAKLKKSKS